MKRRMTFPSMGGVVICLGGCATPFADRLDYDTTPVRAPAAIIVSDPKVYSRQGLISERRKDVEWIDQLIDESRTQTFAPELLREVEQISTLAAALGVKFDPAAGLNYRRDRETGDIQQEIDALKMQFQLEQLRRDLALLRAKWPDQTDPVNSDLGKLPAGTTPDATSTVSASAADQLKQASDRLLLALTGRLDADGKAPKLSTAAVSPIDLFRDRSAYRDLLNSARNAASLDEVHDDADAVLVRLNFQAAVVPDPKRPRSLGVVQIKPHIPLNGPGAGFLRQWAVYLNSDPLRNGLMGDVDRLVDLGFAGRFNISNLLKGYCEELKNASMPSKECEKKELVIPLLLSEFDDSRLQFNDIFFDARKYQSFPKNQPPVGWFQDSLNDLSVATADERKSTLCRMLRGEIAADKQANKLISDLEYVAALTENQDSLRHVFHLMRDLRLPIGAAGDVKGRVAEAEDFIDSIEKALPQCADSVRGYLLPPKKVVWAVTRAGGVANGIRVYEVGPREQVQQVSTVARVANSLALAAKLAASAPGSGAAAEAAASYSRQAMGRADARERVPSVVGYANGSGNDSPIFGWVIGPQARIDPKGRVRMEQSVRTYDLSVDLSVPRFSDSITLEVTSLWGPSPIELVTALQQGITRKIRVPVPVLQNDLDAFSRSLTGAQEPSKVYLQVEGGPVSACRATTLMIQGHSRLWRADSVLIGGILLESKAITVMPDMRGVLVKVPEIVGQSMPKIGIIVLTPDGSFHADVDYVPKPADGCEKPKTPTAAGSGDGPTVTGMDPRDGTFIVPAPIVMRLFGTKLNNIDAVTLRAVKGTIIEKAADGTSLTVSFAEADTHGFRSQDNEKVILYTNKVQKAEHTVRLIRERRD